jgi:hypothetical protein
MDSIIYFLVEISSGDNLVYILLSLFNEQEELNNCMNNCFKLISLGIIQEAGFIEHGIF